MKILVRALVQNHTWDLEPYSPQYNIFGNKWVFKLKFNPNRCVERYKARLIAKGFYQTLGNDFKETFSPVVKAAAIRLVLTVAVSKNWDIRQLDVNNAFLNGTLQEVVYMAQPEGYVDASTPNHICKLNCALYGLKQAPRAWFDKLRATPIQWGFGNSKSDTSLSIFNSNGKTICLLVYVDDILLTRNDELLLNKLTSDLNKEFSLKNLGQIHYFLGIEEYRDATGLYLTQSKYVKPCPTPMTAGKISSGRSQEKGKEQMRNPTLYRSVIGALQHLTLIRPNISYSVNKLSQFMQSPTMMDWQAMKRVLQYLQGSVEYGIHLKPSKILALTAYSDADWSSCPHDRKSISGVNLCIFL